MEPVFTSCTKDSELQQILSLQQKNLITNVSSGEKEKEGFVTVSNTLELLTKMNTACPHILAKDHEKVVGYVLCMQPKFSHDIEVLKPMLLEIATLVHKTEPFIEMGPICIDKK